tara:strand:- start:66 stop:290 length:225 start_codon:yes stop_codon:yes gene_type:complete
MEQHSYSSGAAHDIAPSSSLGGEEKAGKETAREEKTGEEQTGSRARMAYAATNSSEYFAELTVWWFNSHGHLFF